MASPTKIMTYIVVGAGNRGNIYASYAAENPDKARVVGVAEPNEYRRKTFLKEYGQYIDSSNVVEDWKHLTSKEKFADAVVITTPDRLHSEPAIAFANKGISMAMKLFINQGYHLLVEKPLAITEEECINIVKAVKKNNVMLAVGHVLRYTLSTQKIKQLVDSGAIGELISIQHIEPVGYWHYAHSYVRGNWRRQDESCFTLMSKSCHDIDWIRYIMGLKCLRVTSFGSLQHFKKEKKPKEAGNAMRCLDCPLQNECSYSAVTLYLGKAKEGEKGWPVSVIVNAEPDIESVTDALKNGPYGRCVYESDNDVCDNQVVNMEFEGGKTANFTMIAFSKDLCIRKTRIFGTQGQIEADGNKIRLFEFKGTGKETLFDANNSKDVPHTAKMWHHEFGDWFLMNAFVNAIQQNNPKFILSGPLETLESHCLVFAAERARLTNSIVDTTYVEATLNS